jgi:macrolide transport system ATP-binding/permease protein
MSTCLTLSHLSKTFGLQRVLNDVSLTLGSGDRLGLVGMNGAGKSTLLKIIAGVLPPDTGTVTLAPRMELGYLPQVLQTGDAETIAGLIAGALAPLRLLEAEMRALEHQMASATDDLDPIMQRYGDVAERFERAGGYDADHHVEIVLAGLGVDTLPRERTVATLSGGERSRVGLALLLLQSPDVLLLDEPTNHLDVASLNWLEGYLAAYRGAMLVVSHDRVFLNSTVNAIVEIDEHTRQIKRYTGNYDAYRAAKLLERRQWELTYRTQQDELKLLRKEIREGAHRNNNYRAHTDNDKFVVNIKKATHDNTVSRRIRVAEEKLKRLEAELVPEPPDDLRFNADFDPNRLKGRAPLYVSGLTKRYGDCVILNDLHFTLDTQSRVVLVGPNGAGKSTLLKLLAGLEKPDSGEITASGGVNIGYLDQEGTRFAPGMTLFEAYRSGLPGDDQQNKATLIVSGLFRYEDFDKPVGALSSGQQRKLAIARLIAGRANLLLLDEPTNYVSFDVLEAFESALADFPGPVVAVSHDRRFLERFGGELWELADGALLRHTGTYAEVRAERALAFEG